MIALEGKKFEVNYDSQGYIYFRDKESVEISGERTEPCNIQMGTLCGEYKIVKDGDNTKVHIDYVFNESNKVAVYHFSKHADGKWIFTLSTRRVEESLPLLLEFNPDQNGE